MAASTPGNTLACLNFYRLNVKNADYVRNKEKKERALNYWKERVSQDFLPPIDPLKKYRGESLDKLTKLREELIP